MKEIEIEARMDMQNAFKVNIYHGQKIEEKKILSPFFFPLLKPEGI